MKITFVYGILPAIVIYTDRLKFWQAGAANAMIVRIRPHYKNDEGLLAHELEHVKQAYRGILIIHALLYLFAPKYRFWAEVQAYRKQLTLSADKKTDSVKYARAISQKYRIDITFLAAWDCLKEV